MIKGKKNYKYIALFILSIVCLPNTVFAENAVAWVNNNGTRDENIIYSNGHNYQDFQIKVNFEGQNHDAYCADFGLRMGGGNNAAAMTCQEITAPSMAYVLNDPSASHEVKQIASRIIAQGLGYAQSEHVVTSTNETMDTVNQLVANANNYAAGAGGSLLFVRTSSHENVVSYRVSSPIYMNDIQFTCGSGCMVTEQNWNGTTGTVTINAINGACEYTINASYPYSGNITTNTNNTRVIYCTGGEDIQGVTFTINGNGSSSSSSSQTSGTNGRMTQSFRDSIDPTTGGNYYRTYCDDEPDEDLCPCEQQTTINKPNYCDSPDSQFMSITAPTDVKCCILNREDEAGNTYQMLDGQVSSENPYCTVYCKEDYEMSMPGAKYTESGRYFELENTVVNAKRTCYATNPKRNSEETNIDIELFVEDVKKYQQELVDAYNAYKKALREQELAAIANAGNGTPSSGCENPGETTNTGTWYEIESDKYSGYQVTCKTDGTGLCEVTTTEGDTTATGWGTKITTRTEWDEGAQQYNCSESSTTVTEPNWAGEVEAAKIRMTMALNNLKEKITFMKECYSWVNELCLEPDVLFDYNEQYSSSINYELVSGGGTFTGENATYNNNLTIDNEYTTNSAGALENINYLYCDENGCNNINEATLAEQISTLRNHLYYRKIEVNGTAEFANTQEFQTNYPHGTIDTVSNPENIRENYSYLGAKFPVALNTPTGVYQWKLNFTNLGQYNDYVGCRNGRLDTVVNAIGATTGVDTEYVCVYVVDCDDCDYECVGEYCDYEPDEPVCPECDVYCINCIFDGDEDTYFYRRIGNEFNPNDRELGANWTNEKGEATRNEIESTGENVYIEAEYTYVLDANNMKRLRDYNKETGTYVREDLDYHTLNDVRNAYGTSKFLDEGQARGFFTEVKRNTNWTLWTGAMGTAIGPSWK